jgi:DNA-binding transcriptional regulator LsrR (DeoR family)
LVSTVEQKLPLDETELSDETTLLVAAARLFYEEEVHQAEIAKQLHVSQSRVSRLLKKAREDNIVQIQIKPPRDRKTEQALKSVFVSAGKPIREVHLAPDGEGKNTANLGTLGATILLEKLLTIPRDTICISVSCGETLRAVVESLFKLLADDEEALEKLSKKKLEIYPLSLYEDTSLNDKNQPTVAYQCVLMSQRYTTLNVKGKFYNVPPGYYSVVREKSASDAIKEIMHLYSKTMEEARGADIFLIGIGTTRDEKYRQVFNTVYKDHGDMDEYVAESNYIPINIAGSQYPEVEKYFVAVNIDKLRSIIDKEDKYVIAIAGGKEKKKALEAATANPYFNILVTDMEIAKHLMEKIKNRPPAPSKRSPPQAAGL